MKNLPMGVQTFSKFINGNFLYVDKTQDIYNLFADGGQYYFLSRPRRFGKSVLVSTLAEIFSGNKELFKGLWIYDKIEWTKHPVIHLDFSTITFKTPEILEKALDAQVEKIAAEWDIQLNNKLFLKEKFALLIEKMFQSLQQKVVILIDEYDKPIIEFMEVDKIAIAKEIRKVLKNFYSVIKGSDKYLRFVFITGVSKFSRVSIFSDLNNLRDITLSSEFAVLLGYTEAELRTYFEPYIKKQAAALGSGEKQLLNDIKEWYNGYSWDGKNFVYNPYSIVYFFKEKSFGNFWFSTGTPTFLIETIRSRQFGPVDFENLLVQGYIFDSYDIENIAVAALLFQTGYLTIKQITVEDKEKIYALSYPNYEVRNSFLTHLFGAYTKGGGDFDARIPKHMAKAVEADDIEGFTRELSALFASIPHQIIIGEREAYYHTVIYLVLSLAGASVRCEESTNTGRIDAVLETAKNITIMEFKMGTAEEAMAQIKEKKYYEKYLGSGKKIVLLGIGFDADKRNIGNYLVESL